MFKKICSLFSFIIISFLILIIYYFAIYNFYTKKYNNIHNQFSKNIAKHDNVILVSYAAGGAIQFYNQELLSKTAHNHGIDRIFIYSNRDIDSNFYDKNKFILDQKRGAGYWLWKPYIILDAMNRVNEDDIIFYVDSDCTIINDINPLIDLARKHDRVLFYNYYTNRNYIKRDAYILMNCDSEQCYKSIHLGASFLIIKNNKKNRIFIEEWLKFSEDARIVTDQSNIFGENLPGFIDHRHEQAVLSLLSLKYSTNDQIIVSYRDRAKYLTKLESKIYPLAWLYRLEYYKNYIANCLQ